MMRSVWPFLQVLPLVIALVALLALLAQIAELWLTRQNLLGAGYGFDGPSSAERVILVSAFLRVFVDFVWNLGWAAVVYAAVLWVDARNTEMEA